MISKMNKTMKFGILLFAVGMATLFIVPILAIFQMLPFAIGMLILLFGALLMFAGSLKV